MSNLSVDPLMFKIFVNRCTNQSQYSKQEIAGRKIP